MNQPKTTCECGAGAEYIKAICVISDLMSARVFLEPLGLHKLTEQALAKLAHGIDLYLENGQKKHIKESDIRSLKYVTDWLLFESLEDLAKYKAIKEYLEEVLTVMYYDKSRNPYTEQDLSNTIEKLNNIVEKARLA